MSPALDPTGIGIRHSTVQTQQHLQEGVAFKWMLSSICNVYQTLTPSMLILEKELQLYLQPQNLQLFAPCCWVSSLPDKGALTSSPVEESPKISSEAFGVVYQKAEVQKPTQGGSLGIQAKEDAVTWWRLPTTNKGVQVSIYNFGMPLNHLKPQPKDVSFEWHELNVAESTIQWHSCTASCNSSDAGENDLPIIFTVKAWISCTGEVFM